MANLPRSDQVVQGCTHKRNAVVAEFIFDNQYNDLATHLVENINEVHVVIDQSKEYRSDYIGPSKDQGLSGIVIVGPIANSGPPG